MLNTPVRTTIEIDPDLLYFAKLKALAEKKTLKEIVWISLKKYLRFDEIKKTSSLSSSRFTEPKISKQEYLKLLKNIKGVWWTKEDDNAKKRMEEKEKFW